MSARAGTQTTDLVFFGNSPGKQYRSHSMDRSGATRVGKSSEVTLSVDQAKAMWFEDDQLQASIPYNQWSRAVGLAAVAYRGGVSRSPFDVLAILSGQTVGGPAPRSMSQADATTAATNTYQQVLGRDPMGKEGNTAADMIRQQYIAGNDVSTGQRLVMQQIRGMDEYKARLGDGVLDALFDRISADAARRN
jgi:hypothetical protein